MMLFCILSSRKTTCIPFILKFLFCDHPWSKSILGSFMWLQKKSLVINREGREVKLEKGLLDAHLRIRFL
ncbi:hypothetical protein MKX01_001855 [Papaver californicum]|nr:hypothetical protein MKX01_001855 [Papaver californicum]